MTLGYNQMRVVPYHSREAWHRDDWIFRLPDDVFSYALIGKHPPDSKEEK